MEPEIDLDFSFNKRYEFILRDIKFDNLPEELIFEKFKDGRFFSHIIEKWLEKKFMNLIYVNGKGYDFIDSRDNNIKYDEKTFTCRGCNYVPSKMLGAGRKKNLSEFQEHAQKINYIIVDNTEFPKIQLVFISGNDLLLNYPKGKIPIRDRVAFFSRY